MNDSADRSARMLQQKIDSRQLLQATRPGCSGWLSCRGDDRVGADGDASDPAGWRAYSPTISTPAGGVNLKVAAGRTGLRSRLAKRMCVV